MWWIGGHAVMFFFLFSDFYKKAYLHRTVGGAAPRLSQYIPCWLNISDDKVSLLYLFTVLNGIRKIKTKKF